MSKGKTKKRDIKKKKRKLRKKFDKTENKRTIWEILVSE
jgi:hypothetical protein